MKPLCIYHGHCDDGFAAALCVRGALGDGNVDFHLGVYQKDPPDVAGRDVIIVDFSYKRPVLAAMIEHARSLLILDHHKTAAEDLGWLPAPPPWAAWQTIIGNENPSLRCAALFDMERSGAGLAWDYFSEGRARPEFINYIEDRDLWRKRLPGGDEFTIALRSYPQNFAIWDEFIDHPHSLIAEGKSIQRYYRHRVEELKRSAYPAALAGHPIWIANAPYFAASEVAGELAEREGAAFGACYFEVSAGRWQYSLRSRGDFDVSEIARQFGGGGHKGAAGFTDVGPVHRPLEVAS